MTAPVLFLIPARQTKQKRNQQTRKRSAKRGGKSQRDNAVVPRETQRDRQNGIQELWTPVFPARTTRMLRYSTNFTLSSASGVVASYVFSANGLFDPDITGTGHQPMGFDQLMLSYNHYTVTRAKITAVFRNTTSSNPTVSISIQPGPTPITVIDQTLEFGMLYRDVLEMKGVSGSVKTLDAGCSIRKVQGVSDVVDVTDLMGSATANPAEQTYFCVQMWDTSAITGSCIVDVIIEYKAIFLEPRVLSQSLVRTLGALLLSEEKGSCGTRA